MVIHALNEWMHETWTFNYEDRIFATGDHAPDRGEGDRGSSGSRSKAPRSSSCVRRRCPGSTGPRSFALQVRPVLGAGAGEGHRRGHARIRQRLPALHQRVGGREGRRVHARSPAAAPSPPSPLRPPRHHRHDRVGHRPRSMCTRFPKLKIAPVENGSGWVRPSSTTWSRPTRSTRTSSRRTRWRSSSAASSCTLPRGRPGRLCGCHRRRQRAARLRLPAPRGMSDPITFIDDLDGLSDEDQPRSWAATSRRLMNVA